MFKKYYLILTFLLSSFTFSCQLLDNATMVNKVEDLKIVKEIEDETLIKNFTLKWDIEKSNITKLPKNIKEKGQTICKTKKLVMIKIDTDENLKAIGTFNCIG